MLDRAKSHGSHGERALQEHFGTQTRARNFYDKQVLDRLNSSMTQFIARQEMVFIATADAKGECDCSLRAGPPGFVRIADEKTLLYPEYRGNGVLASLGNMCENSHIGMMFVDFFRDTIGLHVNGKVRIVENEALRKLANAPDEALDDLTASDGRKPERWVMVEVQEAYIHCSKHIPLLAKRDKDIAWGTDEERLKGGDYFQLNRCREKPTT